VGHPKIFRENLKTRIPKGYNGSERVNLKCVILTMSIE
jgi:hypothetical protein